MILIAHRPQALFDTLLASRSPLVACAYRTPAVAAVLYNRGGQLARNYGRDKKLSTRDRALLESALEKLELSADIYQENGRGREAAYAHTFAVEALIKLGRADDARERLEQARMLLPDGTDKRADAHRSYVDTLLVQSTSC